MPEDLLAPLEDATGVAVLDVDSPGINELPHVHGLLAGAVDVDITPPPGMPKSGHSKSAQDGTGFRTRLRAPVIYLRAGTTSLALVAGDWHAGSAVVQRLVARSIAETTDVPLAGLFLGATHTHAGPGQYHGSDFFNRFASNRPGFDAAYTRFLVERISRGIEQAYETRRPAKLATGSTEVWGFTRNRSLPAHLRNFSVDDKRSGPERRYSAINPWLHLVRVDAAAASGGFEPLAALAFFSIHGTSIGRHDPAYNADVWAYITGELSRRIEALSSVRAVVGAVEGTHGDITPAVRAGMLVYHEGERVGRGIGEGAAALWERLDPELSSDVQIGTALRELDLSTRPEIDGCTLPDPAVGAALLAGAIENGTPLLDRIPPFSPGHPKPAVLARRGPHGAKWVLGSPRLARFVTPIESFPRVLPIQLLRIGGLGILALPFEVTVEAGRRLEEVTTTSLGANGCRGIVSSAANDYWDYLTTPEEYAAQWYEGGSTLYGPDTLRFVSGAVRRLAADLNSGGVVHDALPNRHFRFHCKRYMARPNGISVSRQVVGEPSFTDATASDDAYWQLTWRDVGPADLAWHEPLARVQSTAAGRVDDNGWHLGVFHDGPDRSSSGHLYSARWYGPPLGLRGENRFVLLTNSGRPEVVSDPFG